MLTWEDNGNNLTLKGLVMNGKESSLTVYMRYENNYIFSCNELGIGLKLVEAPSVEETKKIVLTIVKDRLKSLIFDISENLSTLDKLESNEFVSQEALNEHVQAHRYCA